ncbi:MAG: hypothetical protein LBT25_07310 [Candidatus Symbiothrix sp.]|jgi:hypothetical protein|nr:hypothetical protein [Candidatus Symbiothrix sp.]
MKNIEILEGMCERKYNRMSENLLNEIGHFNVFKLEPYVVANGKPAICKRKDYFKITLFIGKGAVEYADKIIDIQKQALIFSNPQIPYRWKHIDENYRVTFDFSEKKRSNRKK